MIISYLSTSQPLKMVAIHWYNIIMKVSVYRFNSYNDYHDSVRKCNDLDFYDYSCKSNPFNQSNLYKSFFENTPENITNRIRIFVLRMNLLYGIKWYYIKNNENDLVSKEDFSYIRKNIRDIIGLYDEYASENLKNLNIHLTDVVLDNMTCTNIYYDINDENEMIMNLKEHLFFVNSRFLKTTNDIKNIYSYNMTYKVNSHLTD